MNNIEILEKLQNIFKELRKDDEEGHSSAYELQLEDIEAIENLIQRNKDLEQIEKEHKEENGRLRDKIKELEKEIIYWKEQAEGYQGLAEQIKEDFENRDRWE